MRLTWLGHACFYLEGSRKLLIDPFVPNGRPPQDADLVFVTHGHADHLGDALALGRKIVCNNEIAKFLAEKGIPAVGMNIGGTVNVDGISATMVPAIHSSWLESGGRGFYGGLAAGFVIRMDGVTVYDAGDTALFSDMRLIGELYRPDVVMLPIGGHFTMGPQEAMMAAQFVGAPLVIPMHYGTWPVIDQDAQSFRRAIERTTDMRVAVLAPGEGIEVGQE
ncbi:MAG: metal-dependent hydrolase [Methanomicrobiales archaeon]|nr:metal-dependent hydrolase [Methanomicrobiales archaeon]MDI6877261.1 metal-dependent hydrolase [Methanomicrobiales archaeon]